MSEPRLVVSPVMGLGGLVAGGMAAPEEGACWAGACQPTRMRAPRGTTRAMTTRASFMDLLLSNRGLIGVQAPVTRLTTQDTITAPRRSVRAPGRRAGG